jgi:hypothetical protein
LVSQSCLAARPSLSRFRHLGVRDIRVCRPSFGSGQPLTRPASWSGVITALIDCGRIPSARARLDTVAAPLSSRRSTTDTCDGVRSLCCPSARRCRLTLRNAVRISRATVEASSVPGEDVGRLTEQVFHIYSLPVKSICIYAGRVPCGSIQSRRSTPNDFLVLLDACLRSCVVIPIPGYGMLMITSTGMCQKTPHRRELFSTEAPIDQHNQILFLRRPSSGPDVSLR